MKITFIGSSTCIPDIGCEVSSLLINGKHLVDTGWCNVLKMREYGFNPLKIESLILTHLHQDHYLGLPHLLFYLGLKRNQYSNIVPLRIIGPAEHLKTVVNSALSFLQISRFPELKVDFELVPLIPGENYETEELYLETRPTAHVSGADIPEQALVYKFTELATHKSFAYTGDTSFHPPIAKFSKSMPLLIHDVAHSSAKEAANIAKIAQVKSLYLIHYSLKRRVELLNTAREIFPNSFLAKEGETLEV